MKRYIKKDFCPIVSIGIPVYNEAENIKELAESILAQKNINLREVIFIVSGCTDDSAAVVKGFVEKDARFKLYYVRKALVYNKCPITVKDLFIQRVRIFWGHLDIKTRLGYAVGSMDLKLVAEVTFIYMIKNLHFLEYV